MPKWNLKHLTLLLEYVTISSAISVSRMLDSACVVFSTTMSLIESYIRESSVEVPKDLTFNLHAGADSDEPNKITVEIENLSSSGLGVNKIHSNWIGIVDDHRHRRAVRGSGPARSSRHPETGTAQYCRHCQRRPNSTRSTC